MKRFTEALKWRDPWFRELSIDGKLVFFYFVDNCDASGVWEADLSMVNFCLKRDIDWPLVWQEFGDRVVKLPSGKLWMRKFIEFQYGKLTEACAPHRTVIALVAKHGLALDKGSVTLSVPTQYPPDRVQEKEKDKEEERDRNGSDGSWIPANKHALQFRAEKLFRRRPTTVWDGAENKAWGRAKAAVLATEEEDWNLLEWFFALPATTETYRRRDLATLLNNWGAEIDRAREFQSKTRGSGRSGPQRVIKFAQPMGDEVGYPPPNQP